MREYDTRLNRFESAVRLQTVDRVCVASLAIHYYFTRIAGISNRDAMVDYDRRFEAWKEGTQKLDLDLAPPTLPLPSSRQWEIMAVTQYKWPGKGLDDNLAFQFVENEYLRHDEYDEFLANPGDFTVRKLWPRLAEGMLPVAMMPPLHWLSGAAQMVDSLGALCSMPQFVELLEKLIELGKETKAYHSAIRKYAKDMKALGFPLAYIAVALAPFDYVSDLLRGMKGSMLDMFRQPDKLLAVIDLFTPMAIESATMIAKSTKNPRVFIPMHRGAAGFMSDEQFARFYWPGLKNLFLGLVDAGLTPMPFFEGDYNPRLKYLAELPKGKIAGHFDIIDRKEAKKMLGDTMVFWGNVPAALMATGTPDQVSDDVKELIDIFGDSGGLIIDASTGIPDEAKPENVAAMVETAHTYGSC